MIKTNDARRETTTCDDCQDLAKYFVDFKALCSKHFAEQYVQDFEKNSVVGITPYIEKVAQYPDETTS